MRTTLLVLFALCPVVRAQGEVSDIRPDTRPDTQPGVEWFAPPADVAIGGLETGWSPALAIGDIDNDGRRDVVAVNSAKLLATIPQGEAGTDLTLDAVLLGDAPMKFAALCEVRCHPTLIDVDDDGNLDIVFAQAADRSLRCTDAGYFWVAGGGDGTFTTPQPFHGTDGKPLREENRFAAEIGMADLDGDGELDLIRGGKDMHWFASTEAGFDGPRPLGIAGNQPVPVDWDGDGDLDVLAFAPPRRGDPGSIVWYERTESGEFAAARALLDGDFVSFTVTDWDLDGALDLVTVRAETRRAIGGPNQLSDSEIRQKGSLEEILDLSKRDLDDLLATSPLGRSPRELRLRTDRREEILNRIEGLAAMLKPLRDRAQATAPKRRVEVRVQVHLRSR